MKNEDSTNTSEQETLLKDDDEKKVHSKPFYRFFLDYSQTANKMFILLGLIVAALLHFTMTPSKTTVGTTMSSMLQSPLMSNTKRLSCDWSPTNHASCNDLFNKRLPEPQKNIHHEPERRRFLFFGDSTVARLFQDSVLKSHLITSVLENMNHACWSTVIGTPSRLHCEERLAQRCKFNELFNVEYSDEWLPPKADNFEGPIKFGSTNPFCQDCSGCSHNFLHCEMKGEEAAESDENLDSNKCFKKQVAYGGYFSIEFARDVEVQSPEHGTTQENVASYISKSWNNPLHILETWDKPICVISTGHHDAMIPGITVDDYLTNVRWYLFIMKPVCGHIIWLTNTAPAIDDTNFPQTVELLQSYNDGVYKLIESTPEFTESVSFMDVFPASLSWPHHDHIHMDGEWYQNLGKWFTTYM